MDTLDIALPAAEPVIDHEDAIGEPPVGAVGTVELNPPSERDLKVYELVCVRLQSVEAVARRFELAPQTVRNIVRQTREKLAREQFELATRTQQESIQLAYDRLGYQARLLTNAFLRSQRDVEFVHRSFTRKRSATGEEGPPTEKEWTTLHRARPQARLMTEATRIVEKMLALEDEFRAAQQREAIEAQNAQEMEELWNDPEAERIVVKKRPKSEREREQAQVERAARRAERVAAGEAQREAERAAAEERAERDRAMFAATRAAIRAEDEQWEREMAEHRAREERRKRDPEGLRQEEDALYRAALTEMLAEQPELATHPEAIRLAELLGMPLPLGDANASVLSGVSRSAKALAGQEMRAGAASAVAAGSAPQPAA